MQLSKGDRYCGRVLHQNDKLLPQHPVTIRMFKTEKQ